MRKLEGRSLRQEYEAVGRSYSYDHRGNLHAKHLRVEFGCLIGSASWTTASRGNCETVAKINFHNGATGVDQARACFDYVWEIAPPFTTADVDEAF